MVINGGDMLPKTGNPFVRQRKYINHLEKRYFPNFENDRIHYLCCLGNDDMRIFDQRFDEVCSRFEYVHNIAGRKIEINGLEFIGFNLVKDYRFEIKDRCRMDTRETDFPVQDGPGVLSTDNGWFEFQPNGWFEYARELPIIEEELEKLIKPDDMRKAVYVMHQPPYGIGLDVRPDEDQPVGSRAVYSFLAENQPLLSLHGHIHDSPGETGIWEENIGLAVCVQPGQGSGFNALPVHVLIDTETMELTRID